MDDAFLAKGANAVFGYTDYVSTKYTQNTLSEVYTQLLSNDKSLTIDKLWSFVQLDRAGGFPRVAFSRPSRAGLPEKGINYAPARAVPRAAAEGKRREKRESLSLMSGNQPDATCLDIFVSVGASGHAGRKHPR